MAKDKAYQTAQERIEAAKQAGETELDLSGLGLTEIPEVLAQLSNLTQLNFSSNQLTEIPEAISQLSNLTQLWLDSNQLTEIPEAIAQLSNLTYLRLDSNQLTEIPEAIGQLSNLTNLRLENNPLNLILKSAYSGGLEELFSYLKSIQDPTQIEALHEAKLVLIGEGAVGKTTLLKALKGNTPEEDEQTTHGISIDIQALHLPHPDQPDTTLQFNAWDFGGQEVYRVTHQFFFSKRSVYLLLWEPRRGVQQCQVEDWLKMLRLRVGEAARVIIVSTHCKTGERIARIDEPVLKRDYGDMIVGFLEIDSLVEDPETGEKVGMVALKKMIAETAKDFDQMGAKLNRAWLASRDELLQLAKKKPRITYADFQKVCAGHELSKTAMRTLADLMHDLGYIVYYGEDESLKDDVILQPEWLTKAIGFVLEDRTTQEMDGILPDSRLKDVLLNHPFQNEPRYEPEFYPYFLRLMEKYDVSYRLESGTDSLVSQHVPQVRPNLPWLPEDEPEQNRRRLAMTCVMEESPPGLIPWMIVRTHDFIEQRPDENGEDHRLHWQKGMFLSHPDDGEAMLELRDRELHLYVEATWPQYFTNILQQTLQTLITYTWPGLKDRYYLAVPCSSKEGNRPCPGRFKIDILKQFHREGDINHRCHICGARYKIEDLLYGFEDESPNEQLDRIEQKVDQGLLQSVELKSLIANYTMGIMRAIANEAKNGPRLFTLEPVDGNWRRPFNKRYRLYLWCEKENEQHPVYQPDQGIHAGMYELEVSRDWLIQVAPYANLVFSHIGLDR